MTNDKDSGGAFVMPAQAFREGVRWRERQDNNGIVSDQYLAEHNPYRDNDRTVQVPVSLPTREQIAEAIARAVDGMTEKTWQNASADYRGEMLDGADAVIALLSQPTPTAEPQYRQYAAKSYHAREDEPPRIEHMAPGTTFTADDAVGGRTSRWRKEPDGWYSRVVNGGRNVSPEPSIDPSTIRDVTPPTQETK